MASHGLFGLRFGANVFVRILMSLINLQKPITPRYCSIGLYGGGASRQYHRARLAAAMQPFQGRGRLTNHPGVARSSQPWAERVMVHWV